MYRASFEQLEHNRTLFRPGRTLREVVEAEWPIPEEFLPYRYGLAHGVGLKDEYPFLPNRADLDRLSDPDQPIQPNRSSVPRDDAQVLSRFPFEPALLA